MPDALEMIFWAGTDIRRDGRRIKINSCITVWTGSCNVIKRNFLFPNKYSSHVDNSKFGIVADEEGLRENVQKQKPIKKRFTIALAIFAWRWNNKLY